MSTVNQNLYSLFLSRFPENREQAFLDTPEGVTFTYQHLDQQSARLAQRFQSLGLKKGDRLAIQVEKSPHVILVYLAALRAGLIYLPLNTGYRQSELEYFLNDAEPCLIICDPAQHAVMQGIAAGMQNTPHLQTLDAVGGGSIWDSVDTSMDDFATVACHADDVAAILYTSGTTGQPKGAMLSHDNLASNALTLHDYWAWQSDDVLLHALPIFHVHGLFVAIHGALIAGARMIYAANFDPATVNKYLPQTTVMMGVPTFYTRLLANGGFTKDVCANMRLFISGSAPLLAETHDAFRERTGLAILERYGMTETGMLTSNPYEGERRAGTVGFPLPGVEARIVDVQNTPVARGQVGAIQVKGPNVFQGYWRKPEKTVEDFTDDGWFQTGDQGTLSDDGYISIVGRAKDMIITGGLNVYPKEIELVLDEMDGVKESAVIGIPDQDFGEAVTAIIVRDGDIDAGSVKKTAKQELASFKVPKFVHFVDELPRNTMGKVQKKALREIYST